MTRFIQKKIESDFAQKAQNILKPDRAARPHPLVHILSSVCVIKYTQIWRALSGFTFLKQNDFYCLLTSGNRNFQSLECIRSLIRSKPHYCPKRKFNKSNTSKPGWCNKTCVGFYTHFRVEPIKSSPFAKFKSKMNMELLGINTRDICSVWPDKRNGAALITFT